MIIIGTLLICALVYLKENKQQAIKTIICLISIMLLWGGLRSCLFAVNKTEKNPQYVTYSVPLYMLASWVSSDRDIDNDTIELMEKVMPINLLFLLLFIQGIYLGIRCYLNTLYWTNR